ncbi:hypothetical protein [Pseudarthrobacter sp. N5]|uniref:hypothetical protein n=1 Tax=Pseudarthrobacter sp. N5 TaxID=3418416 RepID=UPI003CE6B1C6
MACRDIRRHKGRSLLIIALIMFPVAGMTGAATLFQSSQETAAERVQYQLGNTQARFRALPAMNALMVQDPLTETTVASTAGDPDPDFRAADPKDVLPSGYEVLTESSLNITAEVEEADVPLMGKAVDALNPAFVGKYTLLQGRSPAASDEALVSTGFLARFGLQLGEKLTTSAGTFTAVGTLRDAGYSDGNAILFLKPGQGNVESTPERSGRMSGTLYYLLGPAPVTWAQVREANKVGVAVLSRNVALNPPPANLRSVDGSPPSYVPAPPLSGYLTGGLIGALALLEVGLLAGAAFAVGAKRQVRDLALLAASGADGPTVRTVVTAGGLWLGTVAVVCGAAVGNAGAAAVVIWARHQGSVRLPGFHPDTLLTATAMVMGLGACTLAALVPARQVARQAVLGALKSGRAPSDSGKWAPRLGVLMLVLAVVLFAVGSGLGLVGDDPDLLSSRGPLLAALLIGGAVLTVAALVLLTGTVVGFLTLRTAWLPLPLRMAARDSARNRSRTVPAVAAVLAAATLASAGIVLASSQQEDAKRTHYWSALQNQGVLPLSEPGPLHADGTVPEPKAIDPGVLTMALKQESSTVAWTQVLNSHQPENCDMRPTPDRSIPAVTETSNCLVYALAVPEGNECARTAQGRVKDITDWRCQGSMQPYGGGQIPSLVVGGAAELRAVLGRNASPEALEVLERGGMVVSNGVFVRDGHTAVQANDVRRPLSGSFNVFAGYETVSSTELPAVVEAPPVPVPFYGVISAATADRLGLRAAPRALLVQLTDFPSAAEQDKMSAALATVYRSPIYGLHVEPGTNRDDSWMIWSIVGISALITLSAAGITTGLALADARSDHMTLAGVGAPPRLRKGLAGAQSFMTAALGTVLGLVAGVIPAALIVAATRMFSGTNVPWLQLLALLIAVPLTGAVLAWLFTRARLPMSRRSAST